MEIDNIAGRVHAAVAAVCPIQGIGIGNKADKSTWRIDYDDSATAQQRAAAVAAAQTFSVAASEAAAQAKEARRQAVENAARADQVIDKLRTATLQEIIDYVNTNVTDLASAKTMITKLAIGVAYAIRND